MMEKKKKQEWVCVSCESGSEPCPMFVLASSRLEDYGAAKVSFCKRAALNNHLVNEHRVNRSDLKDIDIEFFKRFKLRESDGLVQRFLHHQGLRQDHGSSRRETASIQSYWYWGHASIFCHVHDLITGEVEPPPHLPPLFEPERVRTVSQEIWDDATAPFRMGGDSDVLSDFIA